MTVCFVSVFLVLSRITSVLVENTKGFVYKGIVCDRCGVEVTEKKVRRDRVGHINLWFLLLIFGTFVLYLIKWDTFLGFLLRKLEYDYLLRTLCCYSTRMLLNLEGTPFKKWISYRRRVFRYIRNTSTRKSIFRRF